MITNKRILASAGAVAVLAGAAACGGGSGSGADAGGGSGSRTINLVAYSTPQKAYEKLAPAFARTASGAGSEVAGSYGPSGAQEKQVAAGQPADVVEFSRASDMEKLVAANLVPSTWDQNKYQGFVTDSVAVLVVRNGNPLGIHSWDDLLKPGVKIVTPNPLSSGSACWNLMAAYGGWLKEGRTPTEALANVKRLLQNTVSQPDSGSDSTAAFIAGTGNVLIAYENEAIAAQQAGDDVDYVTPPDTILIQNPVAVTSDASNPTLDKAFVKFLYSDAGQKLFASAGYRPVVKADLDKSKFPTPTGLFTIDSLGGWDKVNTEFFDPENGSVTKIEDSLGHGVSS